MFKQVNKQKYFYIVRSIFKLLAEIYFLTY